MTALLRHGDRIWIYALGGFGDFEGRARRDYFMMKILVSGKWYAPSELADNVVEFPVRDTCEVQP